MTLRQKTLLIIGVTLVSLVGVLYSASSTILLRGFSHIEQQETRENVKRVQEALANDLAQLNITTRDWAEWDETYAFIENRNKAYINTYLNDNNIASIKLNLMLYVHSSGRIVYGKGFDLAHQKSIPISQNLKKYLFDRSLLRQLSQGSSLTGLVMLPEGPILIAARPVLKTDGSGPSRGTLIMGRYLNATAIKHLAVRTHLSITFYPVEDPQLPDDVQAVRDLLLHKVPILVQPLNTQTVAGYTIIKDISGQPALIVRVDLPRNIYQQGQASIYYLVLSVLVVGLVFSAATLLLLEQLVLSRLSRLSNDVQSIGTSGDLSARLLSMSGKDELSSLAETINSMLEDLAQSQHKQQESRERYYRYSRVLAELTRQQTQEHGDLYARFREITETTACTLEVERVSVWLAITDSSKLECADLYQRSVARHSSGMQFLTSDFPAFYQALEQERTIATEDVRSDPRTQEMSRYLSKLGIVSLLAAPICLNGRIVGTIALAHVGTQRQWLLEEHNFVASLSDLVSLLLEASERLRSQDELRKTYDELEIRIKVNEELHAEIIERHMAEERLIYEAFHDPLTGLPNRSLFMQRLENAVERAKREKYLLAVLFLDLDRFKYINDTLGHLVGDRLLVAIARRLQGCLRPGDLVSRLAGDEFTILLENIKSVTDATHVAERILNELTAPFSLSGHEVHTAASIGIALNTTREERPEDLLHDADLSMYRAKSLGKARYEVFDRNTTEWATKIKMQ